MATRRAEIRASRLQVREQIVSAATDLVRRMSFAELTVDEVMREAGLSRTIFYRHFDDLADLLLRAGREAIDELFEAQRAFGEAPMADSRDAIRSAFVPAVAVYSRHGPLLRAIAEAAAADEEIAAGQQAVRQRFADLAAAALRGLPVVASLPPAHLSEIARALNLMNEAYLLDAFGREPRVPAETVVRTLTEIWMAVAHPGKEPHAE